MCVCVVLLATCGSTLAASGRGGDAASLSLAPVLSQSAIKPAPELPGDYLFWPFFLKGGAMC